MTLFRQITIVFTLFFLLMLAVVLAISFNDSRDYIENELYMKAQNTASTLAVSMSQESGDSAKMAVMAEAVFDTGYYRKIVLKTIDGKEIFKEERPSADVVPAWFARLVHLMPQIGRAQVSSGWHPLGILEVTADESESLRYLYSLFNKIIFIFSAATLVALAIIAVMLKMILRPLEKVEAQAEGVLQNRFILNEKMPRTVELKRMAEAMNSLVTRVKDMHDRLLELTNRNRRLEYTDALTGLNNRRYFMIHYDEILHSDDGRSEGSVLVIHLANTEEANRRFGYDRVNEVLKALANGAERLAGACGECVAARISGLEIAMLMPGTEIAEASEKGRTLIAEARKILDENAMGDLLCLAAAVVSYNGSTSREKLLSSIDLTLNRALASGCDHLETATQKDDLPTRKPQWRNLVTEAIRHGNLKPVLTDIYSENGRDISGRIVFELRKEDGEPVPYAVYGPMMMRLGLFPEYVHYALNYLVERNEVGADRIAMELPLGYLDTTHEFERFVAMVRKLENRGRGFVVEIPEQDLIFNTRETIESIVESLTKENIALGISRFDADERILAKLQVVRPMYVKMHAGRLLDMSDSLRESLLLLLRSVGIKLLIRSVESSEQLDALGDLGIEYYVI
ncbi:LapD/MoxY N-terminal periplasmic domain-containing protein [Hydrogenimonas sp. SS33]|uniref:bifunctional diguanylate cyclase/phosphodiesterase n=1 Tax=Hydrogenimonas leucolamina TaxID=2954236 RepID=UPI00336C2F08